MGDLTPLLSQPKNTSDTKTPPNKHLASVGFTIEKCIGELNWSQFFQAVLISFAWIFDANKHSSLYSPMQCHYGTAPVKTRF